MISKGFSVGEVIKFGWETLKKHLVFFIGLAILSIFLYVITSFWGQDYEKHIFTGILTSILGVILNTIVKTGWINVGLKGADRLVPQFKDFFVNWRSLVYYFVATILYSLLVGIGLILFVIPGLYWATKYGLYGYFIVDQNAGPIEAFKLSDQATYGAKWDFFCFLFIISILNLLGLIAFVFGLVVTVPISYVSEALVYRKLSARPVDRIILPEEATTL